MGLHMYERGLYVDIILECIILERVVVLLSRAQRIVRNIWSTFDIGQALIAQTAGVDQGVRAQNLTQRVLTHS